MYATWKTKSHETTKKTLTDQFLLISLSFWTAKAKQKDDNTYMSPSLNVIAVKTILRPKKEFLVLSITIWGCQFVIYPTHVYLCIQPWCRPGFNQLPGDGCWRKDRQAGKSTSRNIPLDGAISQHSLPQTTNLIYEGQNILQFFKVMKVQTRL